MIYLKNNTILQELYIPRQDYISNTTGSSGTYAEGYADGYESGYTSGSTDGFDSGYTSGSTDGYNSGYTEGYDSGSTDGFNSGYTSGETHQKGLLTSTGITENGEYQRENGWSAITVNVSGSVLEGKEIVVSEDITVVTPDSGYDGFSSVTIDATEYGQENYDSGFDDGYTDGYSSGSSEGYDSGYTEGYQSGSTDGFNSGYTSGETHQKSLLGTTAFTINGSYSAENGYSAITVNVPTGTSYNIEENKQFTANTNGSYSIKPSVYTTVNDSFENGVYRITFEHSGYPTNEIIEVLRVKDFSDPTKGDVSISIVRGQSSYYIGVWSGGTVYRESLTPLTLRFENANEHYGWVKDVGYIENYDLMSAVTLDVNVPMPKIEANKEFTATSNGNYTINPSDIWSITYDSTYARRYDFTINGTIPQTKIGEVAYVVRYDDEDTGEEPSVAIIIGSGNTLTINKNNWDEDDYGDVDFMLWQGKYRLEFDNDNLHTSDFSIIPYSNREKYNAMSAVSLNVNVPQTGETYNIEDTKAVSVSFTNIPIVVAPTKNNIQVTEIIPNKKFSLNASGLSGINHNLYLGCFRDFSITDRYAGNSVIYDGTYFNVDTKYSDYPFTATTESGGTILNIEFLYPTFEWIGNGDGSDYDLLSGTTISFKPDVSSIDVFVEMTGSVKSAYAYQYGVDYLRGVVVSCENYVNSARTEAQNAIISTFTAVTATTNGVYGSSASPLSSITVNVPQTHTGVTYVEYLETDGDEVYWDTNILLSLEPSGCVENRLVFMPLSASSQNNYYISDRYDGYDENTTFSIYANTVMTRASFSTYRNTMYKDITLNTKYDASVRYVSANTMEWTINGDTTQKTITSNEFQRGTVLINAVRRNNGMGYFAKARYYYLKLETNAGVLGEFKPALDQNGVPCFYDEISQTYLYHSGSGNVTYHTTEYDSGYTSGYTDGYGDGFDDANNGFTCINGYDYSDPFNIETYSYNTATTAEAYFEFSFTPTNHYNSIWEDGNSEDSYGISQDSRGVNMFYYDLGCYVPINQEHFTSATSIFCIAEMLVNVANSSCTLNIFNVTDGYVASVSGTPYHFWNGFEINLCYFDDLADLPITFHKLKIYDGGVLVRNYKHTKDCNQWQIKDLVTGTKFVVGGIVG